MTDFNAMICIIGAVMVAMCIVFYGFVLQIERNNEPPIAPVVLSKP